MELAPNEKPKDQEDFPQYILHRQWKLGSTTNGTIVSSGGNHVHATVVSVKRRGEHLGYQVTVTFCLYGWHKLEKSFDCKDAVEWKAYTWPRPNCFSGVCREQGVLR